MQYFIIADTGRQTQDPTQKYHILGVKDNLEDALASATRYSGTTGATTFVPSTDYKLVAEPMQTFKVVTKKI